MNQDQFFTELENVFTECIAIVKAKNNDYAQKSDPFRNFRNSTIVGVPVEQGILVRLMDKTTRVSNLMDKDASVLDESVEDTIKDAINYLAILLVYRIVYRKSK